MELRLPYLLEAVSYSLSKLANALSSDSVGRPWPSLLLLVGLCHPVSAQVLADSSITYRDATVQLPVPLSSVTVRAVYVVQHDSAGRMLRTQTAVCIFGVLEDSLLISFPTPTWAMGALDCSAAYQDWRAHRK